MKELSKRFLAAGLSLCLGFAPAYGEKSKPTPPARADQRVSAAELRDIIAAETYWCEDWSKQKPDCAAVHLTRLGPQGALIESAVMSMSVNPDVVVTIFSKSQLIGDHICAEVDVEAQGYVVYFEGEPSEGETAEDIVGEMKDAMADLSGATVCQSFYHTGDPQVIREEITVDGKRRPDLESTYRLQTSEQGLHLRQNAATPPEETIV